MKYVIFKYKTLYMPVIIPEHVTHSQIKIEDAIPISAGFFKISHGILVEVYGESDSLKLKPNYEIDHRLLSYVLMNMGTAMYLSEDLFETEKQ